MTILNVLGNFFLGPPPPVTAVISQLLFTNKSPLQIYRMSHTLLLQTPKMVLIQKPKAKPPDPPQKNKLNYHPYCNDHSVEGRTSFSCSPQQLVTIVFVILILLPNAFYASHLTFILPLPKLLSAPDPSVYRPWLVRKRDLIKWWPPIWHQRKDCFQAGNHWLYENLNISARCREH